MKKKMAYRKGGAVEKQNGSWAVKDRTVIENFRSNAANTFLVSFPRTGSHWLRMLMELYFERPSLVRVFYYPQSRDYLTLHTHDLDLDFYARKVIYLYRNPVNTIYSQLKYHKEDLSDKKRISYWAKLYAEHLDKWLVKEDFTGQKTSISYERLENEAGEEFRKICTHFDFEYDKARFANIYRKLTKSTTNKKTKHDPQVVDLGDSYILNREIFAQRYADLIWAELLEQKEYLKNFL